MQKVAIIKGLDGKEKAKVFSDSFSSLIEFESFLDFHSKKDSWGKPSTEELDSEGVKTGVVIPADFIIEIQDITAQVEQEHINQESLAYLASTDWMIIRAMDSGIPCPEEVKQARAEARAKIVR